MKGTEYRTALAGIDRVFGLSYYRPETVHRAIGGVLAYLGARRLLAATAGGPDAAGDRRLLSILAEVENAAVRLDATPQRSEQAPARAALWEDIVGGLARLKVLIDRERKVATAAARLASDVA